MDEFGEREGSGRLDQTRPDSTGPERERAREGGKETVVFPPGPSETRPGERSVGPLSGGLVP